MPLFKKKVVKSAEELAIEKKAADIAELGFDPVELMKDWFVRDGETFVAVRKHGRIGWEDTIGADDAWSSYIMEAPTQEQLLRRIYPTAKSTIQAMDVPYKFRLALTKTKNATDSRMVYIATEVFDDKEVELGHALDVFMGLCVHEGCHLKYTNFLEYSKAGAINKVVLNLANMIEDERIEKQCGEELPGFARLLEKVKWWMFDKKFLDDRAKEAKAIRDAKKSLSRAMIAGDEEFEDDGYSDYPDPGDYESDIGPESKVKVESAEDLTGDKPDHELLFKAMTILHQLIRYPLYLDHDDLMFFGKHLKEIKDILTPFPSSTTEVVEAAVDIFEVLKEFYFEELEEKMKEKGMTAEEIKDALEKAAGGLASAVKTEGFSDYTDECAGSGESKTGDIGAGWGREDMCSAAAKKPGLTDIMEGTVEEGSRETYYIKEFDEEHLYKVAKEKVKRFIPAIAKILKAQSKEYKLIHRSMRSGELDTNKLVEAFQGVPTVYLRQGEVRTDKMSLGVLIDESGSMGGSTIMAAREAAILVNEAVKGIPNIEYFAYGHSADTMSAKATEIFIYSEPGHRPKYALGSAEARCQNRDGNAIRGVCERIRKFTSTPTILFVMADGAPCAGDYSGAKAAADVRAAVAEAEKKNIQVIQVCINMSYDPSTMFKHFVVLDEMSTLAIDLGKIIKKACQKLLVQRVS